GTTTSYAFIRHTDVRSSTPAQWYDLCFSTQCSSLTVRPPTSTLFPYTTLFRSARPAAATESSTPRPPRRSTSSGGCVRNRRSTSDRKSTRLNSSHLGISYAVFCLKK